MAVRVHVSASRAAGSEYSTNAGVGRGVAVGTGAFCVGTADMQAREASASRANKSAIGFILTTF